MAYWEFARGQADLEFMLKLDLYPQNLPVPVTETRQIVLVSAELLTLGLGLVLAEGLVDDRPDDIIMLHLALKSVAVNSKVTLFLQIIQDQV